MAAQWWWFEDQLSDDCRDWSLVSYDDGARPCASPAPFRTAALLRLLACSRSPRVHRPLARVRACLPRVCARGCRGLVVAAAAQKLEQAFQQGAADVRVGRWYTVNLKEMAQYNNKTGALRAPTMRCLCLHYA